MFPEREGFSCQSEVSRSPCAFSMKQEKERETNTSVFLRYSKRMEGKKKKGNKDCKTDVAWFSHLVFVRSTGGERVKLANRLLILASKGEEKGKKGKLSVKHSPTLRGEEQHCSVVSS